MNASAIDHIWKGHIVLFGHVFLIDDDNPRQKPPPLDTQHRDRSSVSIFLSKLLTHWHTVREIWQTWAITFYALLLLVSPRHSKWLRKLDALFCALLLQVGKFRKTKSQHCVIFCNYTKKHKICKKQYWIGENREVQEAESSVPPAHIPSPLPPSSTVIIQ